MSWYCLDWKNLCSLLPQLHCHGDGSRLIHVSPCFPAGRRLVFRTAASLWCYSHSLPQTASCYRLQKLPAMTRSITGSTLDILSRRVWKWGPLVGRTGNDLRVVSHFCVDVYDSSVKSSSTSLLQSFESKTYGSQIILFIEQRRHNVPQILTAFFTGH